MALQFDGFEEAGEFEAEVLQQNSLVVGGLRDAALAEFLAIAGGQDDID